MEADNYSIERELGCLLEKYTGVETDSVSEEIARQKIAAYIHDLMGEGWGRLLSFMYLVDVKESLFQLIIKGYPEEEWPLLLADLVLKRLLEKVYTRLSFRQ